MYKAGGFKWECMSGAYPAAMQLLQPAMRIPRRAFHSIPPAVPVPYEVPFTAAQERLYRDLKKECVAALEGGGRIDAVHEGVLRWKLLQIACGCVYDANRIAHIVDASPRVSLLQHVINEAEGKVIVFAPFTSVLKRLYEEFRRKLNCALVTGETSLKGRTKIFKELEEGDLNVIFADPGTMSHGLTLVSANVVVWYGPTDKAEIYVQANQRIDRPGQTKNTYIVQFMSCAVEREIYRRLSRNIKMEGAMLKLLEKDDE
jgi:SNF2 family DNA or RNA helicase